MEENVREEERNEKRPRGEEETIELTVEEMNGGGRGQGLLGFGSQSEFKSPILLQYFVPINIHWASTVCLAEYGTVNTPPDSGRLILPLGLKSEGIKA